MRESNLGRCTAGRRTTFELRPNLLSVLRVALHTVPGTICSCAVP
jgi:hypothetical protein